MFVYLMQTQRNTAGYTLTELLLIIALVGILSVLTTQSYGQAIYKLDAEHTLQKLTSILLLGKFIALSQHTTVTLELKPQQNL